MSDCVLFFPNIGKENAASGISLVKPKEQQDTQNHGATHLYKMRDYLSSLSGDCRCGNAHTVIEHVRKKP